MDAEVDDLIDDLDETELGAEEGIVSEARAGSQLSALASSWRDVQQLRIRLNQRGLKDVAALFLDKVKYLDKKGKEKEKKVGIEIDLGKALVRELHRQPIWPWLDQNHYPRGVHVARLIAVIGDARRFPGQPCSNLTDRHYAPPIYAVGDPCPYLFRKKNKDNGEPVEVPCEGTMLEPRPHDGVRSLQHYLGLHVVNGRTPRRVAGQKADWSTIGRTICLGEGAIADQIVIERVEPYRTRDYDGTHARLIRERGIVESSEINSAIGPVQMEGADGVGEIGRNSGSLHPLRRIEIHNIARKVAVKQFVGDLLMEMKRLAEKNSENENPTGEA